MCLQKYCSNLQRSAVLKIKTDMCRNLIPAHRSILQTPALKSLETTENRNKGQEFNLAQKVLV